MCHITNLVNAPYDCKFCGAPSYIEPGEQTMPPDYCHESDHGDAEAHMAEQQDWEGQVAAFIADRPYAPGHRWLPVLTVIGAALAAAVIACVLIETPEYRVAATGISFVAIAALLYWALDLDAQP